MKQLLVVLGVLGAFASGMAVADYYYWETDSGTQAYTDSSERIPARYRDDAQKVPELSVHDYGRATRVETRAKVAADSEWQGFLKEASGLLEEMHSTIMVPAAHSPMR